MQHQTLFFYAIIGITLSMGALWHYGFLAPTVVCGGKTPEFWQRPDPYPPCEEGLQESL